MGLGGNMKDRKGGGDKAKLVWETMHVERGDAGGAPWEPT